jgi:alkylation response protein AidB-like acyl-CoA dehydrogenase
MGYAEIEELSEDENLLKEEVHRFAEEVVRPASLEIDRMPSSEYPRRVVARDSPYWRVMRAWKRLGYHRGPVPQVFGGEGLPARMVHLMVEEVAWGSSGFAVAMGVDLLPVAFALLSLREDLREELVEPWLEDDQARYQGCWGVTEPEHGSDFVLAGSLPREEWGRVGEGQVRGRREGEGWVIGGSKAAWISCAPVATHVALHFNQDFVRGTGQACVVPLDLPGVRKGPPILKLGQRDCPQGELVFEDVRIPERYVISPLEFTEEEVSLVKGQLLSLTSSWMAASSVGLARAAFEEALRYCRERVQGGKPLVKHQLVRKKLFEMFTRVETARSYSRRVMEHVWRENFERFTFRASYRHALAAQVYCKTVAYEVADAALQLFGAYGTTDEFLIQKLYRDARVKLIEDGTTEVLSLEGGGEVAEGYR